MTILHSLNQIHRHLVSDNPALTFLNARAWKLFRRWGWTLALFPVAFLGWSAFWEQEKVGNGDPAVVFALAFLGYGFFFFKIAQSCTNGIARLLDPLRVEPLLLSLIAPEQIWAAVLINLNRNLLVTTLLLSPVLFMMKLWPWFDIVAVLLSLHILTNVYVLWFCVVGMHWGTRSLGVANGFFLFLYLFFSMTALAGFRNDETWPFILALHPLVPVLQLIGDIFGGQNSQHQITFLGHAIPVLAGFCLFVFLASTAAIISLLSGPIRVPGAVSEVTSKLKEQKEGLFSGVLSMLGKVTEFKILDFSKPTLYSWPFITERLYDNSPALFRRHGFFWRALVGAMLILGAWSLVLDIVMLTEGVRDAGLTAWMFFILLTMPATFFFAYAGRRDRSHDALERERAVGMKPRVIAYAATMLIAVVMLCWAKLEATSQFMIGLLSLPVCCFGLLIIANQLVIQLLLSNRSRYPRQALAGGIAHLLALPLVPFLLAVAVGNTVPWLFDHKIGLNSFCSIMPYMALVDFVPGGQGVNIQFHDDFGHSYYWDFQWIWSLLFLSLETLIAVILLLRRRAAAPQLTNALSTSIPSQPEKSTTLRSILLLGLFALLSSSTAQAAQSLQFSQNYMSHSMATPNSLNVNRGRLHAAIISYTGENVPNLHFLWNDAPSTTTLTLQTDGATPERIVLAPGQAINRIQPSSSLLLRASLDGQGSIIIDRTANPRALGCHTFLSQRVPRNFLYLAPSEHGFPFVPMVAERTPLPEDMMRMNYLHAIFLDGVEDADLSEAQLKALEMWVAMGGVLFLDPPALEQLKNAPFTRGVSIDRAETAMVSVNRSSILKAMPRKQNSPATFMTVLDLYNALPGQAIPIKDVVSLEGCKLIFAEGKEAPRCLQTAGEQPALAAWRFGEGIVSVQAFEGAGDEKLVQAWASLQLQRAITPSDDAAHGLLGANGSYNARGLMQQARIFSTPLPNRNPLAFLFEDRPVNSVWPILILLPGGVLLIYLIAVLRKKTGWKFVVVTFGALFIATTTAIAFIPPHSMMAYVKLDVVSPLPDIHPAPGLDLQKRHQLIDIMLQGKDAVLKNRVHLERFEQAWAMSFPPDVEAPPEAQPSTFELFPPLPQVPKEFWKNYDKGAWRKQRISPSAHVRVNEPSQSGQLTLDLQQVGRSGLPVQGKLTNATKHTFNRGYLVLNIPGQGPGAIALGMPLPQPFAPGAQIGFTYNQRTGAGSMQIIPQSTGISYSTAFGWQWEDAIVMQMGTSARNSSIPGTGVVVGEIGQLTYPPAVDLLFPAKQRLESTFFVQPLTFDGMAMK